MGLYSADDGYNQEDDIEIVSLLNKNTPNPNNNGHYNDDNDNNDNINIESTSRNNNSKKRQRLILEECYRNKSFIMGVIIIIAMIFIVVVVVFFSPLISSSSSSSLSDDDENNNNGTFINSHQNQQQQLFPTRLPSQQPQQQDKITIPIKEKDTDDDEIIITDALSSANTDTDIDNSTKEENKGKEIDATTATSTTASTDDNNDNDNDDWFQLHTGNARIDRAYQLAKKEFYTLSASSAAAAAAAAFTTDDVTSATTPRSSCSTSSSSCLTSTLSYVIELAGGLLLKSDILIQSLQSSTRTESIQFHDNDSDSDSNKLYTVWYQGSGGDDDDDSDSESESDFDCCQSSGLSLGSLSGGSKSSWPTTGVDVVDGSIVGARGSWHLYLYTGNTTFLEWAYETTVASLYRAEQQQNSKLNNKKENGLFYSSSGGSGCNRNNGTTTTQSLSVLLSTNILYYNGYYFAHKMGLLLMENSVTVEALRQRANTLKKNIRNEFWISDDRGYYTSNFIRDEDEDDVKNDSIVSTEEQQIQIDIDILLGQSLMMLSDDFESNHRIQLILKKTPRTTTSTANKTATTTAIATATTIAMPFFVSSYFAIAAARNGRDDIFYEELDKQINVLFEPQYNNNSTFPPSSVTDPSSSAGFLGMIYQGMFGMKFDINPNYILFGPTLLTKYSRRRDRDEQQEDGNVSYDYDCDETISLVNFKYKNAILDIYITGYGNQIKTFKINGIVVEQPPMMLQQQQQKEEEPYSYKLDSYVTGRQVIEIILT